MKTNKIFKVLLLIAIFAVASPAVSNAANLASTPVENNEARLVQLQKRLEEIKAIDTKQLSKAEKQSLRKEVHSIKKEMEGISGGVYLSAGAIIIIALLFILLL